MPKPLRVLLVLLLLCAPAVWGMDEEEPEEAPREAPVETGPGPCIDLQVKAGGAPAAGARVFTIHVPSGHGPSGERITYTGQWRLGASGRGRAWCKPGDFRVAVELPGFAPVISSVKLPQGSADLPLLIELPPGHTLRGHVRDELTGKPLAGARLSARLDDAFGSDLQRVSTTTNAQGAFQLRRLAEGRQYTIDVEARGYIANSELSVEVPSQAPLSFTLTALGWLEGQVLDGATGVPVAGAEVWVGQYEYLRDDKPHPRTDAQGRFSLWVEEGHQHPAAKHGNRAGALPGGVSVKPGRRVQGLVIRLKPTGLLSGKVFAHTSHQPVEQAEVTIRHVDTGWSAIAWTDADGNFDAQRVPMGKYAATADAPGFTKTERQDLRVKPDQELSLHLPLVRESSVAGTVKDSRGRPVKGAVFARPLGKDSDPEESTYGLTNSQGEYSIHKLPAGRYQLEAVKLRGGPPILREVTLAEGEAARADFTF